MSEGKGSERPRRNPLARITNAAASALPVNSIVESVDVDAVADRIDVEGIVERIDVEALVDRIDVDALLARVDVNALLDRVDPDRLLDRVDANALLDRVDPDRLLARLDPDALLDRVDVNKLVERVELDRAVAAIDVNAVVQRVDANALLEQVDPNPLLAKVDADALLARIDPNALLDRVDPAVLLDRVDPDALLDRVDPNRLLDRVDPDALLDRVDVDRLLDRVDPNSVLDRVDMDRLVERLDIPAIVERANVSSIVGESTGRVAGSLLDAIRRQLATVDQIVGRIAFRVVRRDPGKAPPGPPALVGAVTEDTKGRGVIEGHYAGPVARFVAFLIDVGVIFGVYTVTVSALTFFVGSILGIQVAAGSVTAALGVVTLALWAFVYMLIGLVLTSSTVGKALVGLKVVSQDGSPLTARQGLVRVITYPLSFIVFGIGLLGIAFGAKRLAWHDKFAGTCEVFEWGDRSDAAISAPLTRWLEKREAAHGGPPAPKA